MATATRCSVPTAVGLEDPYYNRSNENSLSGTLLRNRKELAPNEEESLPNEVDEMLRVLSAIMGSLAGRAKILSEDRADQDVESEASASTTVIAVSCAVEQPQQGRSISYRVGLPSTRLGLLERCRYELAAMPPMITRSFLESDQAQHIAVPDTIRVMQWNILAQSLAEKSDKFICPDEALNWNYRRWRILEEVLTYGADIICLQEVDHFNFLKATLGRVGFEGCFFPKPDSPCCYIKGNNGPDGCAVFFDSSKYTLLHTERKVLEVFRCQSNQVVIMCTFERKLDSKVFCVATTHLKARVGALLPTLRNEQGKDLLQFVQSHNTNDYPVIYAGDFNAEPTEPVYRTMTQSGNLSSSYAMVASRSSATSATTAATTPVVDNDGNNVCDSASNEPQYTTWKIREDGEVCHTIDYIFFSKDRFNPERVLTMPSDEELGKGRAPSLQYASDHFSLCCDFRLL
ncbi:nocturnin-like isoform X2 [Varroa jacobsoni]|uniref:Nocturnin n=1 Tax=Varroa destructor TaxID=109461 RepID=A0A7M7JUT9_VARDE|nr:nocturnin-like isoform X2 [Varroa destructor]XP_022657046.1 nocturnin-like isoform X2 [Varroa destructor]XP_022657053.1 nocturnin-like isoform X2 [Varroa destructor]XP_022697611.1 nocturnin-like isoform X2 [Varroa jacobsoni]